MTQDPNEETYLPTLKMRITTTHIYFLGGILSNWHPSPKGFIGTRALDLCLPKLDALGIPHPPRNAASTRLLSTFRFRRGEQWMMALKAWLFERENVLGESIIPDDQVDVYKRLQGAMLNTRGPAKSASASASVEDEQRRDLYDSALCRILRSSSPKTQKMLGRKVRNFREDVWAKASGPIVVAGCVARAEVDEELRRVYAESGGRRFVEGSSRDCVWGVGLNWQSEEILEERNWLGTNKLGGCHDEAAKVFLVS